LTELLGAEAQGRLMQARVDPRSVVARPAASAQGVLQGLAGRVTRWEASLAALPLRVARASRPDPDLRPP